jgi:hypothetical protein
MTEKSGTPARLVALGLLFVAATLTACGGGGHASTPPPAPPPPVPQWHVSVAAGVAHAPANGADGYLLPVDGPASAAILTGPRTVTLGPGGVYIGDQGAKLIRLLSDGVVATFVGDGSISDALVGPTYQTTDFGGEDFFVVDNQGQFFGTNTYRDVVTSFMPGAGATILAGTLDQQGAADGDNALFCHPVGIVRDALGTLYVADSCNFAIRRIDVSGHVTTLFGGPQNAGYCVPSKLCDPWAMALDPTGGLVITDVADDLVRRLSPDGVLTVVAGNTSVGDKSVDGTGTRAAFDSPRGIAIDAAGIMYVTDAHKVRRIGPGGVVTTIADLGADGLYGLCLDRDGSLLVVDGTTNQLLRLTPP